MSWLEKEIKKKIVMQFDVKLKKVGKLIALLNCGSFNVVVEGKRDEAALRDSGIECHIMRAVKPPEALVNELVRRSEKPVILFDFDETGNERTKRLEELLISSGVVPDTLMRTKFRHLLGVRFFEDIDVKLRELKEENEKQR